jgi:hypothetical protein
MDVAWMSAILRRTIEALAALGQKRSTRARAPCPVYPSTADSVADKHKGRKWDDASDGRLSTALSLAAGSLVTTHRVAALIISPGLPPGVTSGGINH